MVDDVWTESGQNSSVVQVVIISESRQLQATLNTFGIQVTHYLMNPFLFTLFELWFYDHMCSVCLKNVVFCNVDPNSKWSWANSDLVTMGNGQNPSKVRTESEVGTYRKTSKAYWSSWNVQGKSVYIITLPFESK